ncbi:oxidoreductase [Mycobacterium eburneum]|nr:oxidoreductase [Mycobacterium eburneum]
MPYRVEALRDIADGIREVVLRRPSGLATPRWTPGAHIDLVLGEGMVRQYSLTGQSEDRSALRLGVLYEPDGRGGSRYVHERLKVGDEVTVRGPRNNFALVDAASYLLIAGGIGITPLVPMAAALEAAGADWKLVYGGRTRDSMAYADDLVAKYGDKVSLYPQDEVGLLPVAELIASCVKGTAVYCCGPAPLLAIVESTVAESDLGEESLHIERFEALDDALFGERMPFTVALARSATTLQVPAHRSILDVVEDAGIDVAAVCRQGVCGTCEVRLVEGPVQHRDSVLSKAEREAGQSLMMCVSRAGAGQTLTIDL